MKKDCKIVKICEELFYCGEVGSREEMKDCCSCEEIKDCKEIKDW